jgi:hypothetical protein
VPESELIGARELRCMLVAKWTDHTHCTCITGREICSAPAEFEDC